MTDPIDENWIYLVKGPDEVKVPYVGWQATVLGVIDALKNLPTGPDDDYERLRLIEQLAMFHGTLASEVRRYPTWVHVFGGVSVSKAANVGPGQPNRRMRIAAAKAGGQIAVTVGLASGHVLAGTVCWDEIDDDLVLRTAAAPTYVSDQVAWWADNTHGYGAEAMHIPTTEH